jgi:hypothetical protein
VLKEFGDVWSVIEKGDWDVLVDDMVFDLVCVTVHAPMKSKLCSKTCL